MKKFLLTMIATLALALAANATDATFDFTNFTFNGGTQDPATWTTSYAQHTITYTNPAVTIVFEKANKQSSTIFDQPVTKGFYVSASYSDGTLTGASFVLTQWASKAQTVTLNSSTDGTNFTSTGTTLNITASTTSQTFTITNSSLPAGTKAVKLTFSSTSNQIGIKSCALSYTLDATTTAAPTFSPAGGTYYAPQSVTLASATEGAAIYYTLDGTEPTSSSTAYTAPISVTATTTIKAIAVKDSKSSAVTTATYTFPTTTSVTSISAANALTDNTVATLNFPMTVIYQNGNNLYVTDGTDNTLVYGDLGGLTFTAGQVIPAGVVATKTTYNSLIEMATPIAYTFGTPTTGTEVSPTSVDISSTTLTAADMHKYVLLPLVKESGMTTATTKGFTITSGTATIAGYNNLGIDMTDQFNYQTSNPNQTYNLTGFVSVHGTTVQIVPVKFEIPTGVANVATDAARVLAGNGEISVIGAKSVTVYNAAGAVISREARVACAPGLYIVKADGRATKVIVK